MKIRVLLHFKLIPNYKKVLLDITCIHNYIKRNKDTKFSENYDCSTHELKVSNNLKNVTVPCMLPAIFTKYICLVSISLNQYNTANCTSLPFLPLQNVINTNC